MADPSQPVTSAFLDGWATEANRRRLDLHSQMTSGTQVSKEQAFTLMSQIVAEAIGLVGVAAKTIKEREGK